MGVCARVCVTWFDPYSGGGAGKRIAPPLKHSFANFSFWRKDEKKANFRIFPFNNFNNMHAIVHLEGADKQYMGNGTGSASPSWILGFAHGMIRLNVRDIKQRSTTWSTERIRFIIIIR